MKSKNRCFESKYKMTCISGARCEVLSRRPLCGRHYRCVAVQGPEPRPERRLPHRQDRVPGGQEGESAVSHTLSVKADVTESRAQVAFLSLFNVTAEQWKEETEVPPQGRPSDSLSSQVDIYVIGNYVYYAFFSFNNFFIFMKTEMNVLMIRWRARSWWSF